jgi:type 1 glutamine amidotransferase
VRHVITADTADFRLARDEVYSDLALCQDIEPLLVASAGAAAGGGSGSRPVLWAREIGRGRVVYDALGHDRASLETPEHRRILVRSALWAARSNS